MKNCIHYIACDSLKYCKEAEASAINFRNSCNDAHIILYTDCCFESNSFDDIITIENLIPKGETVFGWSEGRIYFENKIRILQKTQFEKNLYVDGDVKSLINVNCMFEMLEKFSFVLAHDTCRSTKWSDVFRIPLCFPDMNLGLLFYNKSTTVEFFDNWYKNYQIQPQPHDQPSFRKTLWDSNLRYHILPPEFNVRPKKFNNRQDVAIIHGRGEDFLPEVKEYENSILYF